MRKKSKKQIIIDKEKAGFKINRNEEDMDVLTFQDTGDERILEKLYTERVPTMWHLANEYEYLHDSPEDMFSFLKNIWLNCIQKYMKKKGKRIKAKDGSRRTPFNTYLYTAFLNRMNNLKQGRHAKKRTTTEYDGPLSGLVTSLEQEYENEGGTSNLREAVENPVTKRYSLHDEIHFHEVIDKLSNGIKPVKDFLKGVGDGNSLSSLLRKFKTRTGEIRLTNNNYDSLKRNRKGRKTAVARMITENTEISGDFKILDYNLEPDMLSYKVEMKKTPETEIIGRELRRIHGNKECYLSKIKDLTE